MIQTLERLANTIHQRKILDYILSLPMGDETIEIYEIYLASMTFVGIFYKIEEKRDSLPHEKRLLLGHIENNKQLVDELKELEALVSLLSEPKEIISLLFQYKPLIDKLGAELDLILNPDKT